MSFMVKFCGAAGTVTGSCYWVRTDSCQFLVDCGMFQGSKTIKELNYGEFPFDPTKIDFVLLTHAHTDHAGLLPKLVKHGYTGPIYMTDGSRDLLTYMLPDSAFIQEMEVDRLNRRNRQRGRPEVETIYDHDDVSNCLNAVRIVEYDTWNDLGTVRARYWNAGHILGAASIELEVDLGGKKPETVKMLFSGDIGPDDKLFHPDPEAPTSMDYLFCESTYGGRRRQDPTPEVRREVLAKEINDALSAGGALVIPSFAVERTQELLLDLSVLLKNGEIPCVPVFIDSPLAIKVTSVFAEHAGELEDINAGRSPFSHPSFHFTETVDQSKAIARFSEGVIIMAASGMCDAGRIRHHLKNHLWRPQSTVLLVGYQAEGTLGWMLEQGKKMVKIQGEEIRVRARIRTIDTYSGHADGDGLLEWIKGRLPVNRVLFLTHGNEHALAAMREGALALGLPEDKVIVPNLDDDYDLLALEKGPREAKAIRRIKPEVVGKPDWHNDLAELTLDIRSQLDHVTDDQARDELLHNLHDALAAYKTHQAKSRGDSGGRRQGHKQDQGHRQDHSHKRHHRRR
ncbi:MBL fold metallo-hydrolase [Kordiimonas marina]|uniref:MBL fold metallo-hydrolase n=1 Tax=Kordiimonas marina TaxID=2872312 RepID=UPI001FF1D8C9|nr:MBL fold metallo-hydrolase [Kordiimonas marina]MCJ9428821.1 MBL fold metallo-hydrolase [Kordiimonas marina]